MRGAVEGRWWCIYAGALGNEHTNTGYRNNDHESKNEGKREYCSLLHCGLLSLQSFALYAE